MAQPLEPLRRFGEWLVYENGSMVHDLQGYEIDHDRLNESDWWTFFFTEPNFNWNEFIPAYFFACKQANVQSLNLNLNLI